MARVYDFQHHFVPEAIARRTGWVKGQRLDLVEGGIKRMTLHDRMVDLDLQVADMDTGRIDVGVLSCTAGWDLGMDDCRLINDAAAEAVRRHPGRFVGLAHLPLDDAAALDELRRCTGELGLRGATIMSQVNGRPLDHRSLDPFYHACEAQGLPIYVHPVMRVDGHRHCEDYDLGRIIGREFDLATAATRLVAGGVLERFPGLKLVISHLGGGIAAILDRVRAKAYRFGTGLPKSFDEYFGRLYFDMAGFEGSTRAVDCALTAMAPRQLVFATDYPQDFTQMTTDSGVGVDGMAQYVAYVEKMPLPAADRDAILGGTAARLLGL